MSLSICITYQPIPPARKGTTQAIAAALRSLQATPMDSAGNPGSFAVPLKHRGAVRLASEDTGIAVVTRVEGEQVRVWLKADAEKAQDNTVPLPGIDAEGVS